MTGTAGSFGLAVGLAAAIFTSQGTAFAEDATHKVMAAEEIEWAPAPPELPKGTEIAVLFGDPGKSGPFIMRGRIPDGATFPAHWHSQIENVTVLQGTFHLGMGADFDKTKAQPVTVGGFFSLPPKMQHFAWAEGETVLEVVDNGPFDINYVNPEDNPARQATD